MSYGKLHHGDPSTYNLNRDYGHLSADEDDVDSEIGLGNGQREDSSEGYELKDLFAPFNNSGQRAYERELGMAHPSNDDEDHQEEIYVDKSRRESASTTHSFMLYTPDEERAVISKLDRRLVLFVAFLYMLSFLDRSSASKPFLEL